MSDFIITDLLYKHKLIKDSLTIVDCGARGASFQDWNSIHNKLTIHGFDPDESECKRLNVEAQSQGFDHRYYPYFITGKKEKRSCYLTNNNSSNSLYEPNQKRISRYRQLFMCEQMICTLETVGLKERIENIETTSLDEWASDYGIMDVDFIKLDVQGAELEILKGCNSLLHSVVGMNIEVWFVPIYIGQPLFADIDTHVRSRNFDFFTFHIYDAGQFVGRMASPVSFTKINTIEDRKKVGQLVTADALYFRDPIQYGLMSLNKLVKLICFSELCHQIEYSFELLNVLALKMNDSEQVTTAISQIIVEATQHYNSNMKD